MDELFFKQSTLVDIYSSQKNFPIIPQKIGPYKIESLLSRGGMSLLYLGLHPETKQMLAIKVLSPELATHPEMVNRFLKEAQIIEKIDHPNIVKLYGHGTWEGGLYISMEFIRGISLRQFITQQSLSLKRCIDIILQVAYALCHLHTHGIIHGDLKPENILITEEGEVKVIDFGIAYFQEELSKKISPSQKIAGTPVYMSPERKEALSKMSFASDIYSLGMIAYELAMGKLSYGVVHLSLLPKGLRKIIEKALAVSVKERYQDIVLMITDLSQYLKSGGIEKDRPGNDNLKEVLEKVREAVIALSPPTPPSWPGFEIGLAKYRGPLQMNGFYDFFRFPNGTYTVVMAAAETHELDEAIPIGVFRGMVKTVLQNPAPLGKIASTLNHLVASDLTHRKYSFTALTLNPVEESLSFISCGMGGLFHIAPDHLEPRNLSSVHHLLGAEAGSEFFETVGSWSPGDTLTLHSLNSSMEAEIFGALFENRLLSAQGQAEAALKKVSSLPQFTNQKNPKFFISLHHI